MHFRWNVTPEAKEPNRPWKWALWCDVGGVWCVSVYHTGPDAGNDGDGTVRGLGLSVREGKRAVGFSREDECCCCWCCCCLRLLRLWPTERASHPPGLVCEDAPVGWRPSTVVSPPVWKWVESRLMTLVAVRFRFCVLVVRVGRSCRCTTGCRRLRDGTESRWSLRERAVGRLMANYFAVDLNLDKNRNYSRFFWHRK